MIALGMARKIWQVQADDSLTDSEQAALLDAYRTVQQMALDSVP
jgi:hypothetical protein